MVRTLPRIRSANPIPVIEKLLRFFVFVFLYFLFFSPAGLCEGYSAADGYAEVEDVVENGEDVTENCVEKRDSCHEKHLHFFLFFCVCLAPGNLVLEPAEKSAEIQAAEQ